VGEPRRRMKEKERGPAKEKSELKFNTGKNREDVRFGEETDTSKITVLSFSIEALEKGRKPSQEEEAHCGVFGKEAGCKFSGKKGARCSWGGENYTIQSLHREKGE